MTDLSKSDRAALAWTILEAIEEHTPREEWLGMDDLRDMTAGLTPAGTTWEHAHAIVYEDLRGLLEYEATQSTARFRLVQTPRRGADR